MAIIKNPLDKFASFFANLESPASIGFAVTPNSAADMAAVSRSIYVGTAGDLVVTLVGMTDGTFITISNALGYHPLRVKRVWATSTATNIVALY